MQRAISNKNLRGIECLVAQVALKGSSFFAMLSAKELPFNVALHHFAQLGVVYFDGLVPGDAKRTCGT